MKKILVTGGAGFIGSHLCEYLLQKGFQVIALDNFNDFYDPTIKRANIQEIKGLIRERGLPQSIFQVVEDDIRNKQGMDQLFARENPDMLIHLAAMAGVRPSIADPDLYYDVNVTGTLSLLEACRKYGVGKFIFASSSSVYGNNEKVPFAESDFVDHPISPYAATKKAGELLCHTYHSLYGIDMACLRFFTVYGPRQRPDLAIHKFARLLATGQELPFYGDGSTQRDYTYIDDIIDGVYKSMLWVTAADNRFDVFNLGESQTITLEHMVKTLENTMGVKAKLKRLPMQPGDVLRTYADITKPRAVLGYNPSTDFKQGMDKFVQWFRQYNRSRL